MGEEAHPIADLHMCSSLNGGTQNGTNYGANGSQSGQNGQGIGNNNAISSGTQQLQQAVTEAAKPENAMPIASVFDPNPVRKIAHRPSNRIALSHS